MSKYVALCVLALAAMASAECDLERCADYGVVRDCGDLFRLHGINETVWRNCLLACSETNCVANSWEHLFGILAVSPYDPAVWKYDLNGNCYIDDAEVKIPEDKWKTGRDGGETLDIVVGCMNAWSNHLRNPNCGPEPTTCELYCDPWTNDCMTQRRCVDANCKEYPEQRSVNPSCFAYCGDGFCNGVETCGSCSQDCGECYKPPANCPNGQATQTENDACTASNGCVGHRQRTCTNGVWGAWTVCTSEFEKCVDGYCSKTCSTTTTRRTTTTTSPATTTTFHATTTSSMPFIPCINCNPDKNFIDQALNGIQRFFAGIGAWIRELIGGG
jgi:hypothetical protein